MSITHPLVEMAEQLQKAFAAIDENLVPTTRHLEAADTDPTHTWYPNVTIDENGEGYTVRVEARGLDMDELDVNIKNNVLILLDTSHQKDDEDEANVDESELSYGAYTFEISLPDSINPEEVVAEFVDDALEIRMPKRAKVIS